MLVKKINNECGATLLNISVEKTLKLVSSYILNYLPGKLKLFTYCTPFALYMIFNILCTRSPLTSNEIMYFFLKVLITMNNTTDFYNETHLADDPFDEQERSDSYSVENFLRYFLIATKMLADVIIIYSIKKFQILRTWENSLIMHWTILDLLVIFFLLFFHGIISAEINLLVPCLQNTATLTLFLSPNIFAEAILVGFVVLNSKCSMLKNHENTFKKYYVIAIYMLCVLEGIIGFLTCHHWFDNLMFTTHAILFASFIINIFLKRFIKYDGHVTQTYYVVYISNISIFSLVPVIIYDYLYRYLRMYKGFAKFLNETIFIPHSLLFSDSIIILFILYRYCREFRTVLVLIFKKVVMRTGVSWSELQQDI